MKKAKSFHVGDKVFAKVKGYPAWPAQIVSVNGKKYDVTFYGTGESGSLKPEDLFYYLKHKDQFTKSLKRKDYNDAIGQIEADISETGSDGNPNAGDSFTDGNDSFAGEATKVRKSVGGKRKRSSSSQNEHRLSKVSKGSSPEDTKTNIGPPAEQKDDTDTKVNVVPVLEKGAVEVKSDDEVVASVAAKEQESSGKNLDEIEKGFESFVADSDVKSVEDDKKEEGDKDPKKRLLDDSYDEILDNSSATQESEGKPNEEQNGVSLEEDENTGDASYQSSLLELENILLIPDLYLTALTIYAQRIREREEMFKERKPDTGSLDNENDEKKVKVIPAKLKGGKYVGIKFIPKHISEFSSEYDRAMDEEKLAKEMLELKQDIMLGKKEIDENDESILFDLQCRDNDVYQIVQQTIVNYKNAKFRILNIEQDLYQGITNITRSLGLEEAQPKAAIRHLEDISRLEVTAVMLKKNPQFIDTVKRLRRYVGNLQCWHLNEEQEESFNEDAKKICELAKKVFEKFKALFDYKDDEKFYEKFVEDTKVFDKETALTEVQKFSLVAEPLSRKSLLDQIYQELSGITTKSLLDNED